ncbi:MAG TPA: primosomal replication protein PriB/PriC domain protein [Rhodospirillales bacterium]|nr:primosomal replication protein PriB/PriC domain protein [Rhodospirillales bacterium]
MPTAQEMLDAYIAAEQAVLKGQSYTLGDRRVTLADLQWIQQGRAHWERRVEAEARKASQGGLRPAVARWADE